MSKVVVTITPEGKDPVTYPGNLCIAAVRNAEEKSMQLLCIGEGNQDIISNMLMQLVENISSRQTRMERMITLLEIHEKTDELIKSLFDEINNEENGGNDNE